MTPILQFYKLHESVQIPKYETKQSACFDLSYNPHSDIIKAYNSKNVELTINCIKINNYLEILPLDRVLVPTGLIANIQSGFSMRIHMRSSAAFKKGLMLANGEGVIDSDYVNEIFIPVINMSSSSIILSPGERIAQGEIIPHFVCNIQEILNKPVQKTDRTGGIGSTG